MKQASHLPTWDKEQLTELLKKLGNDSQVDWDDPVQCWLADTLIGIATQLRQKLGEDGT